MTDHGLLPGEGAIEYVRTLIGGANREQAAVILQKLRNDPPPDDPRVKICNFCGYLFRDKTKPNNAKVCGKSCKKFTNTLQRQIQRSKSMVVKPKKFTLYQWWHEYPFWAQEKAMLSRAWSYEKPFDPDKIEQISAARQRTQRMNGRKNTVKIVDTGGLNKRGVYTITSSRNALKSGSWGRDEWGEIVTYNLNDRPATEKFVECRGISKRVCPWLF